MQLPFAVKLFERLPPGWETLSERASFRRAHASSDDPNVEALTESAASASR